MESNRCSFRAPSCGNLGRANAAKQRKLCVWPNLLFEKRSLSVSHPITAIYHLVESDQSEVLDRAASSRDATPIPASCDAPFNLEVRYGSGCCGRKHLCGSANAITRSKSLTGGTLSHTFTDRSPRDVASTDIFLTAKEAAQIARLHPVPLLRWAREGRVPHRRLSARKIVFPLGQLTAWLESGYTGSTVRAA